MKLTTFTLAVSLLLISCLNSPLKKNLEDSHWDTIELTPSDSVTLITDTNEHFSPYYYSYLSDKKKGDFIVCYNYDIWEKINSLQFYETKSGILAHRINLKRHTNNKIEDFYPISLDSILIITSEYDILVISAFNNNSDTLLKSKSDDLIPFSFPTMRMSYSNSFVLTRSVYKDTITEGNDDQKSFEAFFNNPFTFALQNSSSDEKPIFIGPYPDSYSQVRNKENLGRVNFPNAVFFDNSIVLNFNLFDTLLAFDLEGKPQDSIATLSSIINVNESIKNLQDISNQQTGLMMKTYQTGNYFDLAVSPNQRSLYRSAYGSDYQRIIFHFVKGFQIQNVYSISPDLNVAWMRALVSDNGFYIRAMRTSDSNPTFYFFSTQTPEDEIH